MSVMSHLGASIQRSFSKMPAAAPVQTTTRITSARVPWMTSSAKGV